MQSAKSIKSLESDCDSPELRRRQTLNSELHQLAQVRMPKIAATVMH
jgi:hypothetical protein